MDPGFSGRGSVGRGPGIITPLLIVKQPREGNNSVGHPVLDQVLDAVVAGDPDAERRFFAALLEPTRIAVERFLPPDSLEADDVVQETLTVAFRYVREGGGFTGDLVRFTITGARNRCRNILSQRQRRPQVPIEPLLDWVANTDRTPLDNLMEEEALSYLQDALNRLSQICRIVLRAFYLMGYSIERIRSLTGLKTVQGVYYRRSVCLKQLANILQDRMAEYSL